MTRIGLVRLRNTDQNEVSETNNYWLEWGLLRPMTNVKFSESNNQWLEWDMFRLIISD